MRFLVTGASGFIGRQLVQNLSSQFGQSNIQLLLPLLPKHSKELSRQNDLISSGFDIVFADLLALPENFSTSVKPFNVLFHLAAFGETESKNTVLNQVNDIGSKNLILSLAQHLKGTRIIFTSTLAAVDRSFSDNTPLAEDYPCHPRTAYGISKLNAETIIKSHAEEIDYQWIIMRLPTVIGSGYRPDGLADVIIENLRRNKLFTALNWPGRIELVYVNDVAEILTKAGALPIQSSNLFHLSSGIAPTLDELIQKISDLFKIKRSRLSMPSFFWNLIRKIIWVQSLYSILPFTLKILFWRLSLIVSDGFVGDGTLLSKNIPHKFMGLSEMLYQTYREN